MERKHRIKIEMRRWRLHLTEDSRWEWRSEDEKGNAPTASRRASTMSTCRIEPFSTYGHDKKELESSIDTHKGIETSAFDSCYRRVRSKQHSIQNAGGWRSGQGMDGRRCTNSGFNCSWSRFVMRGPSNSYIYMFWMVSINKRSAFVLPIYAPFHICVRRVQKPPLWHPPSQTFFSDSISMNKFSAADLDTYFSGRKEGRGERQGCSPVQN